MQISYFGVKYASRSLLCTGVFFCLFFLRAKAGIRNKVSCLACLWGWYGVKTVGCFVLVTLRRSGQTVPRAVPLFGAKLAWPAAQSIIGRLYKIDGTQRLPRLRNTCYNARTPFPLTKCNVLHTMHVYQCCLENVHNTLNLQEIGFSTFCDPPCGARQKAEPNLA